jgi:hypothetical protein
MKKAAGGRGVTPVYDRVPAGMAIAMAQSTVAWRAA